MSENTYRKLSRTAGILAAIAVILSTLGFLAEYGMEYWNLFTENTSIAERLTNPEWVVEIVIVLLVPTILFIITAVETVHLIHALMRVDREAIAEAIGFRMVVLLLSFVFTRAASLYVMSAENAPDRVWIFQTIVSLFFTGAQVIFLYLLWRVYKETTTVFFLDHPAAAFVIPAVYFALSLGYSSLSGTMRITSLLRILGNLSFGDFSAVLGGVAATVLENLESFVIAAVFILVGVMARGLILNDRAASANATEKETEKSAAPAADTVGIR